MILRERESNDLRIRSS